VYLLRDAAAVHDPTAFTDPEIWNGGFHELSWEVGDRDDERLQPAVTALRWAAAITGCCGSTGREPAEQIAIPVTLASLQVWPPTRHYPTPGERTLGGLDRLAITRSAA
jgi:hypothetical protein